MPLIFSAHTAAANTHLAICDLVVTCWFCVYRDVLERNRIKESFVCYAQFRNDSECQKAQRHNRVHIVGNAELFVRRLDEVNF